MTSTQTPQGRDRHAVDSTHTSVTLGCLRDIDDTYPELWEGATLPHRTQIVTGLLLSRDEISAVLEDDDGYRWDVDSATLERWS